MKSTTKLFFIMLIAAGLALPACEKPEEEAEEPAAAEETEQAAEEEEEPAEEEPAEEMPAEDEMAEDEMADDAAEEEGDAAAEGEEGEEAEGDADEQEEAKKPAPAKPAFTGTMQGSVSGGGITNGTLRLIITDDYTASGFLRGQREGQNFNIPLKGGKVSKNNKLTISGKSNQGEITISNATVKSNAIGGSMTGKVFGKDISTVRFTLTK